MNPFSKRSGAFLAALLLCGGALSSAAPGPDPEGEIDKIRAELMRLRAERRALRAELDTGAAAGRRIVSGEVRVESVYAFDVEAQFLDAMVQVNWKPTNNFGGFVGYRIVSYELDYDLGGDAKADLDFAVAGPYLGALFQF